MTESSDRRAILRHRLLLAAVWLLRVVLGATFIMSGLAKAIDIWGFVFKIEEYLDVWQLSSWRSLDFVAALGISGVEFVCGSMLLIGAFRRSVVWWMLAMMCVMLPLTFYIMVASPVADCGCFGDFWVISNTATFVKNIFITAGLIFLVRYNMAAPPLVNPYIQWLPLVFCSVYLIIIGLIGYNVQPLVDFRSFPQGSRLIAADRQDSADDTDEEMTFIYEKDGRRQEFTLDNLPDSTWTYVDRTEPAATAADRTDFVVIEDGEDIAPMIVSGSGTEYLLVVTEPERADISYTLALNELNDNAVARGGSFVALMPAGEADAVEEWNDISMASYEIYTAEPTMLKELARGTMALVKLQDGVIQWKRTVSSLSIDAPSDAEPTGLVELIVLHGPTTLGLMSLILCGAIVVVAFPSVFIRPTRKVLPHMPRRKK